MDEAEENPRRERVSEVERDLRANPLRKDRNYGGLIEEISRIARADATPEDDGYWRQRQGFEVVDHIVDAVNENSWELDREGEEASTRTRVYWRHITHPVLVRKKRNEPYINRDSVEAAAASYIALPYRLDRLDRVLVDLLIAQEMFAFADQMQPVLNRWMPAIPKWLLGNFLSLILGLSFAGFLYWLAPESTFMTITALIVAGLTVLGALWSLFVFPFAYPAMRRQTKNIQDLMLAMSDAYATLTGSPTSTKHLEERVAKATELGVRWPSALIVLIEDIRARRNTI